MIICVSNPEVCQRIRYLQKKYGYSRENFCFLTGMSKKLYDDIEWERELEIPYEVLKELCKVFSRQIEELLHPELFPL